MGMNIYTLDNKHIGKRYAAGIWCWDCKIKVGFNKVCKCGNKVDELKYNSAFRELGFDKTPPKKHTGIDGASGFTWHGESINKAKQSLMRRRFVITEYGDKWTIKEFWEMFKDIITEKNIDGKFC